MITSKNFKQSVQPKVIAPLCMFSRKHPDSREKRILCLQQSFFETVE